VTRQAIGPGDYEWRDSGPNGPGWYDDAHGWFLTAPQAHALAEQRMPALSSVDDRTWACLAHLGSMIVSFIAPLVIMLTIGERSPFVRNQAVEALNFHITMWIFMIGSIVLMFVVIGFVTAAIVAIGYVALTITAAVQASRGVWYRYPVNLRLVH
jgi:uncharacterized Tic20 family protein